LAILSLSYLGGRGDDEVTALAFDGAGALRVAGTTASADFPARSPLQGPGGGRDAFLATLDPASGTLVQATPYGGAGDETGLGLAVERGGSLLLLGGGEGPFLARIAGDGSAVRSTVTLERAAAAVALDPSGRPWIAGTAEEAGLLDAFASRLARDTLLQSSTAASIVRSNKPSRNGP